MARARWSENDTAKLIELYGRVPVEELIAKHFPTKTRASLKWQVERLRLGQRVEWSDKDKELLKKLTSCNIPASLTAELLNRPIRSVNVMASRLGFIRKTPHEQPLTAATEKRGTYDDLDAIAKGTINELSVTAKLMERGFSVCRPITINHKTDLLVLRQRSLIRLQVKASVYDAETNRYRVPLKSRAANRGVRTSYSGADVDFFIVTCPGIEDIYIVPYATAAITEFANLYPSRTKQQHSGVDFEVFKNRFDLLETGLVPATRKGSHCKRNDGQLSPTTVDLPSGRREWAKWEKDVLQLLLENGAPVSVASAALRRSRDSVVAVAWRLKLAGGQLERCEDVDVRDVSRRAKALDARTQGVITENHVANLLLWRGYDVFVPCRANERFDFVVVGKDCAARIQVKGATYDEDTKSFRAMVSTKSVKSGVRRSYSHNEVDLIVVNCGFGQDIYIVPISELKGAWTIRVYPHRHVLSPKSKSYERFLNRYDLLDSIVA